MQSSRSWRPSGSSRCRRRRAESAGVSSSTGRSRPPSGRFWPLQGLYYLAFFWPKLTGGFGADIDAGPITDLETQVFTPDGAVLPLFIPEARAYLVPAPGDAIGPVRGQERGGRRSDGPFPAMCPPRLPGALVCPFAGLRVPVPRVEVQRHRRVFRRSRPAQPRPVRGRDRATTSSSRPARSSRRPGRRCCSSSTRKDLAASAPWPRHDRKPDHGHRPGRRDRLARHALRLGHPQPGWRGGGSQPPAGHRRPGDRDQAAGGRAEGGDRLLGIPRHIAPALLPQRAAATGGLRRGVR